MKEIIVPIYDTLNQNRYRAYFNRERFEIEEYEKGNWISTRNDPDVLFEQIDFTPRNIANISDILNSIKPEYSKLIAEYPFRKIAALSVLYRSPGLADLYKDIPALAVLLVDSYGKGKITIAEASKLVYQPRKEIIKAVGGIGTNSAVNILSKLQFPLNDVSSIAKVRVVISDHSLQKAISKASIRHIDEDLIDCVSDSEAMMEFVAFRKCIESYYGYCQDLSTSKSRWKENIECVHTLLWETHNLIEDLPNKREYLDNLLKCKYQNNIRRLQARILDKLNNGLVEKYSRKYNTASFPEPPVKESENIIAIKNIAELLSESVEMHHCVSSYADKIYEGRYYVYKVIHPERATLGITIKESIVIDQLRLLQNKTASTETWAAVIKWFEENLTCNNSI